MSNQLQKEKVNIGTEFSKISAKVPALWGGEIF